MRRNIFLKSKSAFTLIELLVVISIIAVLMAIMMPALGKVKQMAKATLCKTRLKDLGSMTMLFVQDNSGKLPTNYPQLEETGGKPYNSLSPNDFYNARWQVRLGAYYDRKTNSDYTSANYAWSEGGPYDYEVFRCTEMDKTADPAKGWANVFYGLNYMSAGRLDTHQNWTGNVKIDKITNIQYPLFGCQSSEATAGMLNTYLFTKAGPHPDAVKYGYTGFTDKQGAAPNHNGDCNFLFIDFHVGNVDVSTKGKGPWLDEYAVQNGYSPEWFCATQNVPARIN